MKIRCYLAFFTVFLFSNLSSADDSSLQDQIKSEFGSCYSVFSSNVSVCAPSSCEYPDLSNSKAWKVKMIRGKVNGKCYIVSYSYVGGAILGDPDHCFYDEKQQELLHRQYSMIFNTDSILELRDAKDRIARLDATVCKKMDKAKAAPQ